MTPKTNLCIIFAMLIFLTQSLSGADLSESTDVLHEEIRLLKKLVTEMKAEFNQTNASFRKEIEIIRDSHKNLITDLNNKISKLEQTGIERNVESDSPRQLLSNRKVYDNSFNPSIGVILNGRFSDFSQKNADFGGFGVGEEGERGSESLAVDESELNFSANVDDKFYGSITAAIVREDGSDIVELEEAYIQTLSEFGLPTGLSLKAGRALWTLGYLNEHHAHADDFADRPLVYRAFLNNSFNDDGVEASYVLPTAVYSEIGAGMFKGDDFPGGNSTGSSPQSYSTFVRVGGDIGDNQSWRVGGYFLGTKVGERFSNEEMVSFVGDSDLLAADIRYTWAPTGNAREQELTIQGEFFQRDEDGTYEDRDLPSAITSFDDDTEGWYIQSVYKFHPRWRIGVRYSELNSAETPVGLVGSSLDARGHNPESYSIMADWTNSEFSRLRLQYNHEELANGREDDQLIVQYIISLGAHAAHKY